MHLHKIIYFMSFKCYKKRKLSLLKDTFIETDIYFIYL